MNKARWGWSLKGSSTLSVFVILLFLLFLGGLFLFLSGYDGSIDKSIQCRMR